jgi:thiol-disulfide isomerase/thioredoxin
MKLRAKDKDFSFPYLYDGETEAAARQYGPVSTPHVFLLDEKRIVRYTGRIDDQENPTKVPNHHDTREAIDALLAGKEPPAPTKVFGCSVKWIEKSNWIEKAKDTWAKQPVTVSSIDVTGIHELLKNSSDRLRMINVWATWCGPCVVEFPSLINLQRIYQERDFEFITISADDPANQEKVVKFLKKQQASGGNYLFNEDDKYKLMEAIDPNWQGALPYTILVEPGGKIVYTQQGAIDPEKLRAEIFNNQFIGRLFK